MSLSATQEAQMTTEEDRPPTLSERYGIAITSSHLRLKDDKRGDIDLVMAAGMAGRAHSLGVLLLRLRAEYDMIASELRHADQASRQREAEASKIERQQTDDHDGATLASALRKRSAGEILTTRFLILQRLKTLSEARQAVGAAAIILSVKSEIYPSRPDVVHNLAGKVLDVFLDPLCHHCDGSGFAGSGYRGEKPETCKPCRATGQRRDQVGSENFGAREFAAVLLGELQREVGKAASGMAAVLR